MIQTADQSRLCGLISNCFPENIFFLVGTPRYFEKSFFELAFALRPTPQPPSAGQKIFSNTPALFALFCRKIRTAGAAEGAAPRASSARVATSLTDASGPARLSAPHATLLGTEGEKAQNYFGETLAVLPVM